MTLNREQCDSCHIIQPDMKIIKMGLNICVCSKCYHWVRSSIARRRKIPKWIHPSESFSHTELSQLRLEHATQNQQHRMLYHAISCYYSGPLNDLEWKQALSRLKLGQSNFQHSRIRITSELIEPKMTQLKRAGILSLPEDPSLRSHIVLLAEGHFGADEARLFATVLFLWLTPEDDYISRDPSPWAKSFQLLFEVIEDLGERAYFVHGAIEVVGSSGHIYRIQPKSGRPYFHVEGQVGEKYQHICIDPVGASNVIFGDVLVTLILSLYDDQTSARHIDTLARYLFGGRRGRHITDVQQLWRRALGNMPRELRNNRQDSAISTTMEYIIDRFQTNLSDWSDEGDEA